ncbi:hypothetical protein [Williamwhitmania taraxaci]|uniref:DUF3592 domain-containing protein n=1 Tax=Williamwhitmania taraxaci TaxID=1640674 RepID=A0A1G6IX25_9BACT|nr:hypothetical protein [Williamwhitmania taraxaci]SDC10941.1 hypothetical protein SAMN05216323_101751 [Williamwhitmania taraxaci]
MKFLKAIAVTCGISLFFSLMFTIMFTFYLSYCIRDVVYRDYFVKMVVQIDAKGRGAGRSQGDKIYCMINNKKLVVQVHNSNEVEIDKYYYVWYNTKTDKVYLTDKNSRYYDAYGQLVHALILVFAAIGIAILLFFTIGFIDRRVK